MKKFAAILFLFSILFLTSCGYGTNNLFYQGNNINNRVDKIETIDTSKYISDIPNEYRVLIIADPHFGSKRHTPNVEKLYKWLDECKGTDKYPLFFISLGDNVDHGYEDEYKSYKDFTNKIQNEYKIPTIDIIGNHDLYSSGWEYYSKYCKPQSTCFKFKTKNFTWYALDSGNGVIGEKQYKLIKKDMNEDNSPKIILTHYPTSYMKFVFGLQNTTERNLLLSLFVHTNVKMVLTGHVHKYNFYQYNGFQEYSFPSFNYGESWAVLDVNENEQTLKITICK